MHHYEEQQNKLWVIPHVVEQRGGGQVLKAIIALHPIGVLRKISYE